MLHHATRTKAKEVRRAPRKAEKKRAKSSRSKDAPSRDGEGGAARSLWTGAIAFGLVQIPVKLLARESHEDLAFHQLDRRDLSRIRYERVNEATGKKVEWDDVVKGYELPGGKWVTLDDHELEAAHVEATHTIDIQDFVAREEIPPAFFEKPYFVAPDGKSKKAYAVFRDVLEKKGLVAIALVVIRTRQRLAAVFPEGDGLVLETLRFAEELKSPDEVLADLPSRAGATAKELALAEQLVESLAGKWDPAKYRDTFRDEILKSIETKAKTGKLPAPRTTRPSASNVTDLVALLERSVAKLPASSAASPKKSKKKAA